MEEIKRQLFFIVDGDPQGKGRPRVTRHGTFTPDKTKAEEKRIADACREAMLMHGNPRMFEGAIYVSIGAHFSIPKSWSKAKKKKAANGWKTGKPDADNIAKLVCDSMNGIAWSDDSQVVCLDVRKTYCEGTDEGFYAISIMDYNAAEEAEDG